jgi:hypothetical protein|tara:strand:+ start:328 stop:474 length:147 start_codon:yes stop_codon:yes gene_type:complete
MDKDKYIDSQFFIFKYFIRDIFRYKQLVELRNFITEIIDEKVENGYTD